MIDLQTKDLFSCVLDCRSTRQAFFLAGGYSITNNLTQLSWWLLAQYLQYNPGWSPGSWRMTDARMVRKWMDLMEWMALAADGSWSSLDDTYNYVSEISYEESLPFFYALTSALLMFFSPTLQRGRCILFARGMLLHLNLERRDLRWGHRIFIWQGMLLRPLLTANGNQEVGTWLSSASISSCCRR